MDIYTDNIRTMPISDRLSLVDRIWRDICDGDEQIPLPNWAVSEAKRRLEELRANPTSGMTHDEVWKLIDEKRER
jgi:putative addiction module component (TIGR02574 family)